MVLAAALSTTGAAQATVVTLNYIGTLDTAVVGNGFGLTLADTISATFSFEDSLITGVGTESLTLGTTGNAAGIAATGGADLSFRIGSTTYTEADDSLFGSGDPTITFSQGVVRSIDFLSVGFPCFRVGDPTGLGFESLDDNSFELQISGTFALVTPPTTAPEPGSLMLCGIAVLGFAVAGAVRRRRTAVTTA
jgi:hypothetical protein